MGGSSLGDALSGSTVLLMDGAMGTELQRAGLADGECAELWDLVHPDRVRRVHERYVEAGARVLLTNTFQANISALARWGLDGQLSDIARAGVAIARSVAGDERFVLGDMGPVPDDAAEASLQALLPGFREADGFLVETCSNLRNVAGVVRAQAANPRALPVLCSATYQRTRNGNIETIDGLSPEHVAREADRIGVAALGVNCGREIGPNEIGEVLRRYRQETALPLFARPNAGTPSRDPGIWIYPRRPVDLAREFVATALDIGVRMIGGCCGTTPEHIRAFASVLREWTAENA